MHRKLIEILNTKRNNSNETHINASSLKTKQKHNIKRNTNRNHNNNCYLIVAFICDSDQF